MPIDDRWKVEAGDQSVFAPGNKPEKPDPNKLWSDEQYRGLIEQEPDEERRRMQTDALEEKDYAMLNEMIADSPDTTIAQDQEPEPAPPTEEDE